MSGPKVHILILAAGASSRMAPRDKLLEEIGGEPLLRRVARRAVETGAPVIVVLPPDRPLRAQALYGLPLTCVIAPDAANGMTASLRAGIAALPPGTPGAMILPADMPGPTTEDLRQMLDLFDAHPQTILRATAEDGREGHPAVFPADLFGALRELTGDEGGRSVLKANRHRLRLVPLPGDRAVLDLDTPEDWAAFRSSGGQ